MLASFFPFAFHMAGMVYLVSALVLGAAFLCFAIQFSRQLTLNRARQLFIVSIIYLPLLLSAMVWDKLK
jgi:protoheme IX farnesyltransferase